MYIPFNLTRWIIYFTYLYIYFIFQVCLVRAQTTSEKWVTTDVSTCKQDTNHVFTAVMTLFYSLLSANLTNLTQIMFDFNRCF